MNFRAKIGIKEIQAHYYFGAKIQIFLARFFSRFDIIDNFPTIWIFAPKLNMYAVFGAKFQILEKLSIISKREKKLITVIF